MNIIITGASAGIGYEAALLLSKDNTNHVIAVARREDRLKSLKEKAKKKNQAANLDYVVGDISHDNDLAYISKFIGSKFKKVDILINNAGLLINRPFEELTADDWLNIYSTNVFGIVNLIRAVLPMMKKGGHIVNISSMGGVQGSVKFKGLSAYSSSKAALVNITECLAEEFKEKGIAVNCLALGSANTEMFSAAFPSFKAAMSAKDMASYVAEFALSGSNYFNGKVIPVSNSTP